MCNHGYKLVISRKHCSCMYNRAVINLLCLQPIFGLNQSIALLKAFNSKEQISLYLKLFQTNFTRNFLLIFYFLHQRAEPFGGGVESLNKYIKESSETSFVYNPFLD